jgi:hypothetical protein
MGMRCKKEENVRVEREKESLENYKARGREKWKQRRKE